MMNIAAKAVNTETIDFAETLLLRVNSMKNPQTSPLGLVINMFFIFLKINNYANIIILSISIYGKHLFRTN